MAKPPKGKEVSLTSPTRPNNQNPWNVIGTSPIAEKCMVAKRVRISMNSGGKYNDGLQSSLDAFSAIASKSPKP